MYYRFVYSNAFIRIYSLYIHKNQMEKCLSQVLYGVMDKYYLPHDTAETGGASNNTAARNDVLKT